MAKDKTWTKAEVEAKAKERFGKLDPEKLKKIVEMLMTIFQALLPLFMKGGETSATAQATFDAVKLLARHAK